PCPFRTEAAKRKRRRACAHRLCSCRPEASTLLFLVLVALVLLFATLLVLLIPLLLVLLAGFLVLLALLILRHLAGIALLLISHNCTFL
ncbi:hypothetical protein KZ291_32635, partial [Escherichia coli]|uniref:hypothetical protein n=1 Tax=Escherichia coli TaxID=562 RepID=UPI001EDC83FF